MKNRLSIHISSTFGSRKEDKGQNKMICKYARSGALSNLFWSTIESQIIAKLTFNKTLLNLCYDTNWKVIGNWCTLKM